MKKSTALRTLGLLGVLLSTQLLSACVVLPAPGYHPRHGAVIVGPGYGPPPAPQPYYHPHRRQRWHD